jgi:DNA-binding IclR family transcriptional regulator
MRKRDPSGCQALERGITVLRQLAVHGSEGMRLVDVQKATGLTRGTLHRILGALSRQGLVEQDYSTRRYRIGRETNFISSDYGRWAQRLRSLCRTPLREAASEVGDTLVLLAKSGHSSICVDRYSGPATHQPLSVEVGTRRPLIAGAGGLAILSTLAPDEVPAIVDDASKAHSEYFYYVTKKMVHYAVNQARKRGYAFSDGYVRPNVRSVGVALRDRDGQAIGALCAVAVFERLQPLEAGRIAEILNKHKMLIEDGLRTDASE